MAEEYIDEEPQFGAARTVEVYHIEEAVRQAQLARARYSIRLPLRGRSEVVEVSPVGVVGAQTQGGTPVVTDEPHDTWESESA